MSEITKEMVEAAVDKVLAENSWPIHQTYDDAGLDRDGYVSFTLEILAALAVSRPQESGTVCPSCRETCAQIAGAPLQQYEAPAHPGIMWRHEVSALLAKRGAAIRALPAHSTGERAEVRHALSVIKTLCCGDASEHGWAAHLQTTKNRMRIADICDDALATLAAPPQPTAEQPVCPKCLGTKEAPVPGSYFRGGPVMLPCPDCSPPPTPLKPEQKT